MNKILSHFFYYLKYLLLLIAFALVFYGIIMTYKRLDKSLVESIPVFIPFLLVFIVFIFNVFLKKLSLKDHLFYNFVACFVLGVIIYIGLRAKFDTNMLLYYKYKIQYNPLYLSDNIGFIKLMLYFLGASNIFLLIEERLKLK